VGLSFPIPRRIKENNGRETSTFLAGLSILLKTFNRKKSLFLVTFYVLVKGLLLILRRQFMSLKNTDPNNWNQIYKEFASLIGKENTLKIYEMYKGLYVNFPMKLLSKEGLENIVVEESKKESPTKIAKRYGYSLRHINRVIKESKNSN